MDSNEVNETVNTVEVEVSPEVAAEVTQVEAKQEATKTEPQKEGYQFPKTDDPALDFALSKAAEWGLTAESPSVIAAINDGNFDLLRLELASNPAATGYEALLDFVKNARDSALKEQEATAQREEEAAYQRELETQTICYELAGGEEAFQEQIGWLRENAEAEEKEAFNDLLGKGGRHAAIAALAMRALYEQNATYEPKAQVSSQKAVEIADEPEDYGEAFTKLYAKYGKNTQGTEAYRQLRNRFNLN